MSENGYRKREQRFSGLAPPGMRNLKRVKAARRADWGTGGKGGENSLPNGHFLLPFLQYIDVYAVNSISPSEVSSATQLPFLSDDTARLPDTECLNLLTACRTIGWQSPRARHPQAELCTHRSSSGGTARFRAFRDYGI